uniref:Reverse transcriptase domain-containing protein n=1 Tax=Oryzias melastigma TaxID=30732 RepID=A0A3B3B509_ORYME
MDTFIAKHNLLADNQYGFRANMSTSFAIIEAVEEITNALESKQIAVGIFIDIKKAFDTVDHNLLLHKLEKYGFRGLVLKWIKSYLTNRRQYVQLGDVCSSEMNIISGVPQGSVLGPKLFILFINDLCSVSQAMKMVLFADDTNIFCSGENLNELLNLATKEMKKIKAWFDCNNLAFNLDKTKIMVFGNNKNELIQFEINGVKVEVVHENRFLGVIIDDKMSWKPHIKQIQNKVSRSLAILNNVKHLLNYKSLHMLYCSLILPYFSYCAEIWGNNYITSIKPLIVLQKRAIRVIHKAGYYDHTHPLFTHSKLLKLKDLVNYLTAQIMHKAQNKMLPNNIQKLFTSRDGGYSLRGQFRFKINITRTRRKQFCISFCGARLWNSISDKIKNSPSIRLFKIQYRSKIFNDYIIINKCGAIVDV